MMNKPCHVGLMSCGQPCGQRMSCGHNCAAVCHTGRCPPCTQPCGQKRVHCDHHCEATCHPGSVCEDVPCRRKVKVACACGLRVEEKVCGASSAAPLPQHAVPRCLASCERTSGALASGSSEPT